MAKPKSFNKILIRSFLVILIGTIVYCVYYGTNISREIFSEQITSWKITPEGDCALVLTGGPGRIREGFDLLSRKGVDHLIISGVNPSAGISEIFPQWAYYGSVDKKKVTLEHRSQTTWGNAQQSLPLVEALNCQKVVLVTSRLHMPRARKIFRSVFPAHISLVYHSTVYGDYKPSFPRLSLEVVKSLFYELWAY